LTATTDAPTIANLGHHSYFTLQPGSDVRDHRMMVAADFYTPLDRFLIPTGEIRSVIDTVYDFRILRPIRAEHGPGYDINFVLNQGWLPRATGRGAQSAGYWSTVPGSTTTSAGRSGSLSRMSRWCRTCSTGRSASTASRCC